MLLKSFGLAGRLFHVSIMRCEKKYLIVQINAVTARNKFVHMTSRTSGMNETGECEKVICSTIYKTEDNLVSVDKVIS